jgi:ribose 5-phosphate isomerase B
MVIADNEEKYENSNWNRPMQTDAINWVDLGAYNAESSDYPVFAQAVCEQILDGRAQAGVLLCGTGVGMAIAANRYKKIYAALAWNTEVARLSKEHDFANILVLPADFLSGNDAVACVRAWLHAQSLQDRHKIRIEMIDRLG